MSDEPDLVHLESPNERSLATLTLAAGTLIWLLLIVGSFGGMLLLLGIGFVVYLFLHSALAAWIEGNGVEIGERQLPALHARFAACCERLQVREPPRAFLLNGNGRLEGFATRFLGHRFVVLRGDLVDALEPLPDGIDFYLGRELGHVRMHHLSLQFLRWPVLWLPLLGAAYARAKEGTADLHGRACVDEPAHAARALALLGTGRGRWQDVDLDALCDQARATGGFWLSFHELTGGTPWLTRRVLRLLRSEAELPPRHPLAWIPAAITPYVGRAGGGWGMLVALYALMSLVTAVAVPAWETHQAKVLVSQAIPAAQPALRAVQAYVAAHDNHMPADLAELHVAESPMKDVQLELVPEQNLLTIALGRTGKLDFRLDVDTSSGGSRWTCMYRHPLREDEVPRDCQQPSEFDTDDEDSGGSEP